MSFFLVKHANAILLQPDHSLESAMRWELERLQENHRADPAGLMRGVRSEDVGGGVMYYRRQDGDTLSVWADLKAVFGLYRSVYSGDEQHAFLKQLRAAYDHDPLHPFWRKRANKPLVPAMLKVTD